MILTCSASGPPEDLATPQQRMRRILELLAKEPLSVEGLRRRLEEQGLPISRRQLFLDLGALKDDLGPERLSSIPRSAVTGKVPKDCAKDRAFWVLTGTAVHAVTAPGTVVLGQDELLALEMAQHLLDGPGGQENPLSQALRGLAKRLGAASMTDAHVQVAGFGAQPLVGNMLQRCLVALRHEEGMQITYVRIGGLEHEHMAVAPVKLSLQEGEWYLAAWVVPESAIRYEISLAPQVPPSRAQGNLRLLKVACITDAQPCPRPMAPTSVQRLAEDALELAFRSFYDGKRHQVELRLSTMVLEQVMRRKWGKSQTSEANVYPGTDRPHVLTFKTAGLEALLPWLLQFAGEVEVIRPAELRYQARWAAEALLKTHDPAQDPPPIMMLGDDDEGAVDGIPNEKVSACVIAAESADSQARLAIETVRLGKTVGGVVQEVLYTLRNPGPPRRKRRRDLPWAPMPIQGS